MPTVVASLSSGTFASTRSVTTGTVTGWTPQGNDAVVLVINLAQSTSVTFTLPSGWVNALGGSTLVTNPTGGDNLLVLYHLVTGAEVAAVTTSWTLTNLLDVAKGGRRSVVVLRGVDPVTPIDSSATAFGSSTALGIPGVTPTKTGSLVIGVGGGNATGTNKTVTSPSVPWSGVVGTGSSMTQLLPIVQCITPTVAGSPFSGVSLALSATDDWTAAAVAFTAASSNAFFALF